jgi:predicted house-cleaning noncanonical NTP pyrophosphatase (MazG superfamily)
MKQKVPRPYKDLPKRHKDFIHHYIRKGDAREAYRAAGYKFNDRTLMPNSRKLLRELQPYIKDKLSEHIKSTELAVIGLRTVVHLAEEAESEVVRLNAAKELMSRTFPEDPKEVHHHHTSEVKHLSDTQLMEQIQRLQEKMFLEATPVEVEVVNRNAGTPDAGGGTGEEAEVQST